MKQYSMMDANSTFERFFAENQPTNETEEKMLMQVIPERKVNYYDVLGVSKNSTLE